MFRNEQLCVRTYDYARNLADRRSSELNLGGATKPEQHCSSPAIIHGEQPAPPSPPARLRNFHYLLDQILHYAEEPIDALKFVSVLYSEGLLATTSSNPECQASQRTRLYRQRGCSGRNGCPSAYHR